MIVTMFVGPVGQRGADRDEVVDELLQLLGPAAEADGAGLDQVWRS